MNNKLEACYGERKICRKLYTSVGFGEYDISKKLDDLATKSNHIESVYFNPDDLEINVVLKEGKLDIDKKIGVRDRVVDVVRDYLEYAIDVPQNPVEEMRDTEKNSNFHNYLKNHKAMLTDSIIMGDEITVSL